MTPFTRHQALPQGGNTPAISSALLRKAPEPEDDRPLGRRLLYLAAVLCGIIAFVVTTMNRNWPDIWVFRLIYRAHDGLYLPLKGTLWTAWFPWSLTLWLPVTVIACYAATSWVTGTDPLRRIQRHIILRVATARTSATHSEASAGAIRLARIAAAGRPFGLGSAYLHAVIDHARAEELDHIEAAVLAGESPTPARLSRALALVDADLLVGLATRRKRLDKQLLHTIFDLAFLSHIDGSREGPVTHRVERIIAMLDQSGRLPELPGVDQAAATGGENNYDLLRALHDARPVANSLSTIETRFAILDNMTSSSGSRAQAAELPDPPDLFADMVPGALVFAFFNPPNRHWAALACEALDAIETAWTGLVLSERSTLHANALAKTIERSRLRSCRYLIQHRWASEEPAIAAPLWPDRSPLAWSLEGGKIAAGAG